MKKSTELRSFSSALHSLAARSLLLLLLLHTDRETEIQTQIEDLLLRPRPNLFNLQVCYPAPCNSLMSSAFISSVFFFWLLLAFPCFFHCFFFVACVPFCFLPWFHRFFGSACSSLSSFRGQLLRRVFLS